MIIFIHELGWLKLIYYFDIMINLKNIKLDNSPSNYIPSPAHIPVTDCLKKRISDGKLTVTLNNYDNNRYTQTLSINDKTTLRVVFDDITMSGKDSSKETFQLILNNSLTIPCTLKEFYPQYDLLLQGVDCAGDIHPNSPHIDQPSHPDALMQ
jgi:hypothetical protein